MRNTIEKKKKNRISNVYRNALQLIGVGSVTGVFAGAAVTLFTLLAEKGEEISQNA